MTSINITNKFDLFRRKKITGATRNKYFISKYINLYLSGTLL